jgi:small subunit ribosomal protein S15
MLRVYVEQGTCIITILSRSTGTELLFSVSRAATATFVSASSSLSTSTLRASFHTSATLSVESARKRQARLTRQKNLAKREEIRKKAAASRPHVILGTVTGGDNNVTDTKWTTCDLARVLVRPEELAPDAAPQRISLPATSDSSSNPDTAAAAATTEAAEVGAAEETEVRVPPSLAFGMREREKRMVFEHLPLLSADMSTRREMNALRRVNVEEMAAHHAGALAAGARQANAMAAMVDLRNANAAGVMFENHRRVIEAFSEPGKPNDTGRTEVQGACLLSLFRSGFRPPFLWASFPSWGGRRHSPQSITCRRNRLILL